MASTFVNDLRLEEIGSGEQSGTWGDTTNTNLELIAEAFAFGTEAITTNADTHTTTIADGATDPGRSLFLKYTGTLDSACTITIGPNTVSKLWFIENGTSGSQNIIISQGSGANITIPAGQTKAIYSNGAGSGAAMVDAFATLNVVDLLVDDDLTVTDDVAIGGLATVGGTLGVTGIATFTDDIIIGDGKTIGSASDVDAMSISSGGVVNFSARPTFAASLTIQDGGSLGSASDLNAMTISSGGVVAVTATTASSSSTTGALTVGGGLGVAADLFVGDDFDVAGDAVIDLTCLVTGVLTTTAATVFNGGFASNAPSTITTADNLDQLNIISTDADANSGPGISLYRNSGSPADNDGLGKIAFHFEDDGDNKVRGGGIFTTLLDASDGTEDVSMILETMIAGAEGQRISMLPTEIVINDSSIDLDFRVESNLDTHALFVDGAQSGAVGIGVTPEIWSSSLDFLQIGTAASFWGSTNTSVAVVQSNAYFNASDTYKYINTDQAAQYIQVDGTHVFSSAVSGSADATVTFVESLKIDASSNILIASTGGTLSTATAGTSNLRLGVNAGNSILSGGNQNVLLGDEAGTAITLGDENVFVGFQSGDALVDGTFNVAIGSNSLTADTKGKKSVAVGTNALSTQNFTSLTDTFNTAVGHSAGTGVTSGINNTLIGALAGAALTTATKNTHVGYSAGGVGVITGTRNCTLGHEAGKALTSGSSNVYIGAFTGLGEQSGTANTAIGDAAYITEADGDENTAIGSQALKLNQSASNENTMIGSKAGFGNGSSATTFGGCTFVGRNTGNSGRSSTFATLVGRNVDQSGAAVNAEIVLGSNVVGGGANTVRVGTAAGNATIDCDGSDTSWAASSDSRLKTDVATCAVGLDFIKDLRPITFKWNTKDAVANTLPQYDADKSEPVYGSGQIQHGFLAQEVKTAIDAHSGLKNGFTMWSEDPNGTQQVAPAALIPMLVKAIQELEARIAVLEG